MTATAVALLVLGAAFSGSGAGIVRAGGRRLGASITLTGLLLLAGAIAEVAGRPVWTERFATVALLGVLPVAVLIHPDGTLPRTVGRTALVVILGTGALALALPVSFLRTGVAGMATFVLLLAAVWWRYEYAGERERQGVLWLALGAGLAGLVSAHLAFLAENDVGLGLGTAACLAVPAALYVGAVVPALRDVRALIVRVVVLVVAVLSFLAVFVGLVSAAVLATGRTPSPGATALIGALCAVGFAPVAALLRGAVDRMLFGDRAAPLAAASHVGERLCDDPVVALRALREALVLPYAALVREGHVVAASGAQPEAVRSVLLRAGERTVGELVVGLRRGATVLDAADRTVLRIVAPALAQTLVARELAEQVRDSRAGMITAVEEERRRLRRDLHDGLGPTLTGVGFAADAARNILTSDPAGASALLRGLRADVADAIAEIRRLVEGLRPPALDELGLVGALRQQADRMHSADGRPLVVRIDVPDPMPALPAAVEVAAYRIVTEALTNVARHAGCAEAAVRLRPDSTGLRIDVRDGGRAGGTWAPGVGLASIRDRAELLGGTVCAGSADGGGHVAVSLPI